MKHPALIKRMDGIWQAIITSVGYCELCGYGGSLVGHHAIRTKGQGFATRWVIDNGSCLCSDIKGCHQKVHDACDCRGPMLRTLMIERIGIERYEAVQFLHDSRTWSIDDLREVLADLERVAVDMGVEIS